MNYFAVALCFLEDSVILLNVISCLSLLLVRMTVTRPSVAGIKKKNISRNECEIHSQTKNLKVFRCFYDNIPSFITGLTLILCMGPDISF